MPVQFTNLLAAIDGSEGGWRALDVAIAMTKAAGGSLAVITVGVALTGRELAEFRRAEGEGTDASEVFAERLLAEARRRVDRAAGKPARTLLRWGDPAEAIINAIAEEKFNAIVVGRRGRGQTGRIATRQCVAKTGEPRALYRRRRRAVTSSACGRPSGLIHLRPPVFWCAM